MADATQSPMPPTVGSKVPAFALPGRSGKLVSPQDYQGRNWILVYFYPKDDTPGCTKEACSLRDSWKDLQAAGIVVLGVSRDSAESHEKFAAKYNLPFELLTDSSNEVHSLFGAWGQNPNPVWGVGPLRKSFLVDKEGKVAHVFDKVDTERHGEQVLNVYREKTGAKAAAPAAQPAPAAPAPKPAAPPAPMPAVAAPAPKPAAPVAPKPAAPVAPKPVAPAAPPKTVAPAPKPAPAKAVKPAAKPAKKAAPKKKKAAPKKKVAARPAKKKAAPKKKAASRPAKKSAPKKKAAKKSPKKKGAKKGKRPAKKAGKKR